MKKIIYVCDKCGQEIEENDPYRLTVAKVLVEAPEQGVKMIVCPRPYPEIDGLHFCKDCMDLLIDRIKHYMKKEDGKKKGDASSSCDAATGSSGEEPQKKIRLWEGSGA